MDVSFTNVLEGARQYFQGLPVPSTAGTTSSTENIATSTSSSYGHGDVTASVSGPTSSSTIAAVSREAPGAQQRVELGSRGPEDRQDASQVGNSYWNPHGPVEPYPPQPTRVEVPDTRPTDGTCVSLEAPAGSLTEMQPASKQAYDHAAAHSSSPSSSSPAQLHQLQPPKACSTPPVYQQLNTVSRTPYSTAADMLPAHSSYQAVERAPPSPAMVAPRTQYYPRYHHPEITKSTPLPMTQSSTYQSANAVPSSGVVQQSVTRSSPAEQSCALPPGPGAQSHVHESRDLRSPALRGHGSGYPNSVQANGAHQQHAAAQGYTVRNAVIPTSNQQQQRHQLQQPGSAASSSAAGNPAAHQVAVHGNNAHTHIPSPHNLPQHIPSPQNPARVNPSPLQHHVVGAGNAAGSTGYCPRVSPHMPPPNSVYHSPSPHEATSYHPPSPHPTNNSSTFQPRSPTYPPPPQAPAQSTPHSYSSSSSQHYQQPSSYPSTAAGYAQPQLSGYHSQLQPKNSTSGYYSQSNRSQPYAVPPVSAPSTANPGGQYGAHGKSIAYNGVQDAGRRNCPEAERPYGVQSYQTPVSVQRTSNTHNLPPIATLSYHYDRNSREALSKAQPMHRQQQRPQSSITKNSSTTGLTPNPARLSDYPVAVNNQHANGNVVTSASSMYSRVGGQPGVYPRYATTMAPSHHGSNATSTTVTSNGAPISNIPTVPTPMSSTIVNPGYPSRSGGRSVNPYPLTPHQPQENYAYKDYPSASTAYPTSTVVSQSVPPPSSPSTLQTNGAPTSNRKRESPLDLSLRTIKTPADSTAQDDPEASCSGDKIVSSSNAASSRNAGRTVLVPPGAAYPVYDGRSFGHSRSPASGVRASTPLQTVRAPKVDFLPNFSSTPLHHPAHESNSLRRSSSHIYAPSPRVNPAAVAPLPNIATFKKAPAAPSSLPYEKNPPYRVGNVARPRYAPVMEPGGNAIRHQEYTSDLSKYHVDRNKMAHVQPSAYGRDRQPATKRTAADPTPYTGLSKQPRVEKWRQSIDQQIEQRLSNALQERQRQEMSLNAPVSNGVNSAVVPAGYDQRRENNSAYNYCDKRNYPEIKGAARGSFAPASPAVYGNQGGTPRVTGHSHIPQSSGHQNLYSAGYRHGQGQHASYRVPASHVPNSGPNAEQPSNAGTDKKRVLSLLRNSLENKQQREEQLSNSQQPILANYNQPSFQNKVVTPVEPKTNIGRHNLSPFTAASLLERNSTTPPHYKFHVPRAVDSIIQEPSHSLYGTRVNSSATIPGKEANSMTRGIENQIHRDKDDGLAAILAARIRTKAELKQVSAGQFGAKPTVASSQEISATPKDIENGASTSTPQSGSSGGSPPKLTREQVASLPPRRRLFSRTDEDLPVAATIPAPAPTPAKASVVPPRASGFRSSSETSVFDFRESDSEGEMPVLERQTLEEMRRDRRQLSKVQPPVPLNNAMCMRMASSSDLVKIELKENDKIIEPDSFWSTTCDKFMEQLRSGDVTTKKRGRRKKGESGSGSATKLETDSALNSDAESAPRLEVKPEDIKQEVPDVPSETVKIKEEVIEVKTENDCLENLEIKTEPDESDIKTEKVEKIVERDSDELPLIQRAARKNSTKIESDGEEEIVGRKKRSRRGSRIKLISSSGSESSSEESEASAEFGHGSSVADRLRARKRSSANAETEGMKLRSRDTTPHKAPKDKEGKSSPAKGSVSQKGKPKPLFGDGSDFRPGWEDEVYVYKKSLRMPTRLITVSKPSRFHRLSTSLPDLDPGSPALSVSMESTDNERIRISDSDLESNCSFSLAGLESKIDDEEATSSTTMSCPTKSTRQTRLENNSIIDLLAQKVGTSKKEQKRRAKEKLIKCPKILPKGRNEPELLATPSLAPLLSNDLATTQKTKGKTPVKSNKSPKPIKVTNSCLLGYFRKQTVNNFRDAFKNNHTLPNEFSTFVLKSRTRTETRVLKKQATIRAVFGEDRPASAPPMQNHGDTSQDDDDSQNETQESKPGKSRTLKQKVVSRLKSAGILRSNKALMNSKLHLLNPKKRNNLLKSLAKKKFQHIKKEKIQKEDETKQELDETSEMQETESNGPEVEPENADEIGVPSKKRLKLRTGRRKFRSGFDYMRKKKKPLKKDDVTSKDRKRQTVPRPSPESVADIQTEIRTWVIKKGVGETILHRAARLGYTDVAAYCLEKLNNPPSPKDNAGYTPLHEACSKGHLEIAKLLLAYGANVSESANGGIRPLHEAAENGATELVRLLLSYGADPLLATYAGQTPLMLASDTDAYLILEQHLDDVQGRPAAPWSFAGPSSIFESNWFTDLEPTGYSPLSEPPMDIPEPELEDIEMEVSDVNLPVLYSLANDPDKWVLLQDLTAVLRVKSRDALLRQVNPKAPAGPPAVAHRDVMRELKLPDFLEQSRCCHLLSGGERINVRASKVTLIKYNDKVKSLLNVERVVISSR
ncbi:uncharacterized protein LOC124174469 isoform X2 [Neodiprion fabricii]|uniref:uncharacterized protein LOC124174469 isoform X2 n=1 Tax=Neodiprion fabricii TaxID=2872261 RepID=UPI001ED97CBB|nr:uncharacterized protein LOC124174469 isoform X2 [Neodiprion fabricii]